jgi:hypothetical protein
VTTAEALVAVDPEPVTGVGVARDVRFETDACVPEMAAGTAPGLDLLDEPGTVRVPQRELGTVELTAELPERGLGRLERLLRPSARGDIRALRLSN